MNAIVAGVLTREAVKTQATPHPLTLIALFCGVGIGGIARHGFHGVRSGHRLLLSARVARLSQSFMKVRSASKMD